MQSGRQFRMQSGGSVRNEYSYTGGFAGSNSGTIEGSRASGDVEQSASSSGAFCGENSGLLARCLSEGSVHGTGSRIGGFAGTIQAARSGILEAGAQ